VTDTSVLPTRRAHRRELRALKRRLRPLRWRNFSCWFGWHDYQKYGHDPLGLCRYCYAPNYYVGGGLAHRVERWQVAVDEAVADGVIDDAS
jgi:hypothetical protein